MPTQSGLVTKQELIDAQLDTAHLGRVVNSKDASGNPINTSTNRDGGVNKTLDALEAEYLEAIQGAGGESVGTWTAGVTTFTKYNEYAVYNGIPYKPRTSATLPYVAQGADPTIGPDDANVQPYQEITEDQVVAIVEAAIPLETDKIVSSLSEALLLDLDEGYVRTESRGAYGGGALYKITNDAANGFDKIAMSNGNTLSMIQEDKFITLEQLGAEPRDDFDSLLTFNFARDNYQFVTTENPGVFYTSDELVPKSGMVFISETSSNSTSVRDLELAALPSSLINPSNWQGKAIFRASLTDIGGSLGGDLSGCEFGPFDIDATGADYAFYARYLTNESRVRRITARNSNVCNICVLTAWFAKYDGLTSMRANDKGISIGYALSGETGDIAVNAIEFENVRANLSGQSDYNKALWVDGVDVKVNALDGAGIIISANACNFPTLQAEKGIGVGVVDATAFNNSFGSIYTEGNCSQMTTGRADFVGKNSGTRKVVQVQNVFIGSTGDNAYYLEPNVLVDAGMTTRNSADNTYFAESEQVIMRNANSLAFANQDSDVLAKEQFTYASFYNVNLRYNSQLNDARFFTDGSVSFPYVVLIPRSDYNMTSALSLNIDGNTSRGYGPNFTAGEPIQLRHTGIDSGGHKLNSIGTLPPSDFLCDLYVIERRPASGFSQVG